MNFGTMKDDKLVEEFFSMIFVYYESLKRALKTKTIHSIVRGTGTPTDRDEVNK